MSSEAIKTRQDQILQALVQDGKISGPEAAALPASENMESIISDISRITNDEHSVAVAVSKAMKIKLFVQIEEGRKASLGPNKSGWLIYDSTVFMCNPLDRRSIEQASAFARQSGIAMGGLSVGVIAGQTLDALRTLDAEDDDAVVVDKEIQNARATQRINDMLVEAARKDASDIHLQPMLGGKTAIRFRIDGDLKTQRTYSSAMHDSIYRVIIENKCDLSLKTLEPQDGRFDFEAGSNKKVNIRMSSLPVASGSEKTLKLVLRLLGNSMHLVDLNRLEMAPANKAMLQRFGQLPNGMIVMTGPTGSGKTTTIHAFLKDIYRQNPNKNYQTIEDPVEMQHEGMTHSEVTEQLSFAQILKSVLRQDPDVIFVGEIRDEETAELAYRAAMTGHLVMTSLHTNTAHESLDRLILLDIPLNIIATNTTAFMAQRLVKTLCQHCRKQYLFQSDKERFDRYRDNRAFSDSSDVGEITLYKRDPRGCDKCGVDSGGLKGRQGILEILELTPEIQDAILSGLSSTAIRRASIQDGTFYDLWDDGLRLVREGKVEFEELERKLLPYMIDRGGNKHSGTHQHQQPPVSAKVSSVKTLAASL